MALVPEMAQYSLNSLEKLSLERFLKACYRKGMCQVTRDKKEMSNQITSNITQMKKINPVHT